MLQRKEGTNLKGIRRAGWGSCHFQCWGHPERVSEPHQASLPFPQNAVPATEGHSQEGAKEVVPRVVSTE